MTEAILLVACVLLAAAVVGLGVALARLRDRVRALEGLPIPSAGSLRDTSSLGSSGQVVTGASAPSSTSEGEPAVSADEEYVITRLGSPDDVDASLEHPDARLFADLVLRESVVKAASFAHGVRRGLSPENRNRIWFEMRREVRRARKQRKADEREAVREWKARQRASLREDDAA